MTMEDQHTKCRLCSDQLEEAVHLFLSPYSRDLVDLLLIQLEESEDLPSYACKSCIQFINQMKEFRQKIETTQEFLLTMTRPQSPPREDIIVQEDANEEEIWKLPEDAVITYDEDSDVNVDTHTGEEEEENEQEVIVEHNYSQLLGSKLELKFKENAHFDSKLEQMKVLNCNVCRATSKTFLELCVHMERRHEIPISLGYVVCCHNRFNLFTVYDHLRYHDDQDKFKCSNCDQRCLSMYGLKKHKNKRHSTDKQPRSSDRKLAANMKKPSKSASNEIECDLCTKKFKTKSYFRQHRRAHEKTFKCDQCPSLFSYRQTLWRHKTTAHARDEV